MNDSDEPSSRLELADNVAVAAVAQHLVGSVIDALVKELDGPIAHQEVSAADMLRLESLARRPVLPVIAAGVNRVRAQRRSRRIPTWFTDAENLEVDGRRRRHPQRIEV